MESSSSSIVEMPTSVGAFLFLELLVVSYLDFKTNKIFNAWFLLNLAVFPLMLILFKEVYSLSVETFIIPFVWIFVGFFLFRLNIMGAGDSKYLSSFFLLIPPRLQQEMLMDIIFGTVLIGIPLVMYNFYKHGTILVTAFRMHNFVVFRQYFGQKFTYAPVILVCYVWFLVKNYRVIPL